MTQIKTGRTEEDSIAVREILDEVSHAAGSDARVLITGNTEIGKEAIARRIHSQSARCDGPFVVANCAATQSVLMDTLARASRGTLFIDEISALDAVLQEALLNYLETAEAARRVAAPGVDRGADVRIIAASRRNLYHQVIAGRFNETLFYRLNVIHIVDPEHRGWDEEVQESPEKTSSECKVFRH
jgi:DNA-binding NtrC family response regulator